MSGFLDQTEIDKLEAELVQLNVKKSKADSAREKVKAMYYDITSTPLFSELKTLDEIGQAINDMDIRIKPNSKYSVAFINLKSSYLKRL